MKPFYKIATLTLMMCVVSGFAFSQSAVKQKPATTTQNLVRGVIGPVGSNNSWANYTVMNIIPGSGLFPITSTTSVFYWGFTAGTEADSARQRSHYGGDAGHARRRFQSEHHPFEHIGVPGSAFHDHSLYCPFRPDDNHALTG